MITFVLAFLALLFLLVIFLAGFTARTTRRIDALLPPLGQSIDIDGARIQYVDKGSGPPILMIHGLGAQMRHFTYAMVDRLAPDFRVVVIDRPGSGNSTRAPGSSANVIAQAKLIAHFIDELGLEHPLVVGHSLGGAISLALAVEHPGHVRGLVLISPLTQVQQEIPEMLRVLVIRSPIVRRFLSRTVATPIGILQRDRILVSLFAPDAMPADFATAGGGLLGLRPSQFVSASEDIVALENGVAELTQLVERYQTLAVPVGILYGTGDQLLDHRLHGIHTAGQIPGAHLELIEGGHMLPLTAPDQAVSLVRRIDKLS